MAFAELPENPNLEQLKKQAKALLKAVRAGDEDALGRVGPYFGDPASIGLQYAQLVLAREYGFSSWTKLKDEVNRSAPRSAPVGDRLANRFLDLVCLAYGVDVDPGPHRLEEAGQLLAEHPEIADENIYVAAAIGDVGRIERWLTQDPGLINRKGGYFNWEPVMYAAYGRLPGVSTLTAGLKLLERGADPNAHYMWGGQYKFTALTGVFGQGEGGPVNFPEHPDCVAFARAMLEAGANPNDSQAAYNRFFEPDNTCLELLLEFGLSSKDRNNWFVEVEGSMLHNPSETMHFQLIQSLRRRYKDRVKLLIDHGVDLSKPDDTYETITKGKLPYEIALLSGQDDIAEYMLANGARKTELSSLDKFRAACVRGDIGAARALLEADGTLADAAKPGEREMLCDAVGQDNRDALATMIELGFALSIPSTRTPLHDAAYQGRLEAARMLVEAGADTVLRDPTYAAGPIGFALHAGQTEMIALLDREPMDIFAAAARGNLAQLREHLVKDAEAHAVRFSQIRPAECGPQDNDWMTPLAYGVLNGQEAAVRLLIAHGADLDVGDGAGNTIRHLAEEGGDPAILAAIGGD
ncbi:MAG: hypothetical protein GY948_04995 [Alphaproteobacteria bacterium]|nr:hypothetical protein [Alphaproteobacteria bacterium]